MLDAIRHFFYLLFNPEGLKELVHNGGAPLVCTIVFIETGFFVGFFLPGDSLLVTAGIFSAAGVIPLKWVLAPVMLCAIVGDQIGYWIGRSAGAALYRREDSVFFRRSHLQRAHDFYEKYGGRAVILARFVPIIRTFCPPVAGAARMPYRAALRRRLGEEALERDSIEGCLLPFLVRSRSEVKVGSERVEVCTGDARIEFH